MRVHKWFIWATCILWHPSKNQHNSSNKKKWSELVFPGFLPFNIKKILILNKITYNFSQKENKCPFSHNQLYQQVTGKYIFLSESIKNIISLNFPSQLTKSKNSHFLKIKFSKTTINEGKASNSTVLPNKGATGTLATEHLTWGQCARVMEF